MIIPTVGSTVGVTTPSPPPTVRRREVDGHREIELRPGKKQKL